MALGLMTAAIVVLVGCKPATETEKAPEPEKAPEGEASLPSDAALVSAKEVEVGCAGCTYSMAGAEGCSVAVKVDGKTYLATETGIDAHDAGLCQKTKKATISGAISGNNFAATSFELKAE